MLRVWGSSEAGVQASALCVDWFRLVARIEADLLKLLLGALPVPAVTTAVDAWMCERQKVSAAAAALRLALAGLPEIAVLTSSMGLIRGRTNIL